MSERLRLGYGKIALAWASFTTFAFLINSTFGDTSLLAVALKGLPILEQLGLGSVLGLVVAIALCASIRYLAIFSPILAAMRRQSQTIDLVQPKAFWRALLIGSGEEILFRGALQPILGLWWGSIAFVFAHSVVLTTRTWAGIVYVVYLFAAGVSLGGIFERFGLIAAIAAHVSFNAALYLFLGHLKQSTRR